MAQWYRRNINGQLTSGENNQSTGISGGENVGENNRAAWRRNENVIIINNGESG